MEKGLGYARMTVPNRPELTNKPVIIQIGGKLLEDLLAAMQRLIDAAATKVELAGKVNTYEANDIEALSTTMLNKLKAGDVVVKKTGTERHAYRVAYKDDTKHECALVYCDAWNVEELYYDKSVGNAWSLIEKKVTVIATPNE